MYPVTVYCREHRLITGRTEGVLGNVTFWVRYEEVSGGYRVYRAYSH